MESEDGLSMEEGHEADDENDDAMYNHLGFMLAGEGGKFLKRDTFTPPFMRSNKQKKGGDF